MNKINKIKGYRNMLGFTQQELGNRLGISKQAYNLKEKGVIKFNDREKVVIKEMLTPHFPNITIDDIFFN